jgi:hypothetical protein
MPTNRQKQFLARQSGLKRNAVRRAAQKETARKEAVAYRNNNFPIAISILSAGVLLLLLRIIFGSLSSDMSSGTLNENGGLIGPFETTSSQLHSLHLKYDIKHARTRWCSVSILLLDENKNVITGANKDLYYESDSEGSYKEDRMHYGLIVDQPGTYYYQVIPEYQKNSTPKKQFDYQLRHHYFGSNFLFPASLLILLAGAIYMAYIFLDYELTKYIPSLKTELSIKQIKKSLVILIPIILFFMITSFFRMGYADTENVPSTFFSNGDTHYFGK